MRVAVLSYPMLFQTQGGLQIQILETINALQRRGIDARLIDPGREQLSDFDLVHVFSAINGNRRIVEHAHAVGLPVVTSPLLQPHWTKRLGITARVIERLVGKATHWEIKTEYAQVLSCLTRSNHLIALGEREKQSIVDAFLIPPERITVIPNGIPARFFTATDELARTTTGLEAGYILNVASINAHKNQLAIAEAVATDGWPVVIAGECLPCEAPYLASCRAHSHVHYMGKFNYDDPLLPSLYAGAGVFCLPSQSEVMPLTILESLAAGTPVVATHNHCMDTAGMEDVLIQVSPNDRGGIREAIRHFREHRPTAEQCQAAVRRFTWNSVAAAIHECYTSVLVSRPAA